MPLILKLEAMAGDHVVDTAHEMVNIAEKLNVNVEVKFNEVTLIAYKGGDAKELCENFYEAFSSSCSVKMATTHKKQ